MKIGTYQNRPYDNFDAFFTEDFTFRAESGKLLKEIELGPVWSGPSVSRGRVYIGTGNTLFSQRESSALSATPGFESCAIPARHCAHEVPMQENRR